MDRISRAVAAFLTVPTSWSGDFASVGWVIPLRRFLGLLSLLLVPACGQSDGVADVLLVATVDVTPPSASIGPQGSLPLTASCPPVRLPVRPAPPASCRSRRPGWLGPWPWAAPWR